MPSVAFTARITEFDGGRRTVHLSAAESDAVINTALLLDEASVTAGDSRRGTLTVTRSVSHPSTATGARPVTATETIVLELAHASRPTQRQFEDLAALSAWEDHHPEGARLTPAGAAATRFEQVSPASTRRLLTAGWLTPDGGGPHGRVRLSYAGRMVMTLHRHRLRTGSIGTEAWASGAIWGAWVGCPPLYVAACGCGWYSPHRSEDPAIARGHGRNHRQGELQQLFTM